MGQPALPAVATMATHTISEQRLTALFGMRLWDDGQDYYFYLGMGLEKFTVEPSSSSHWHPIFRAGDPRRSINSS